jgi:hypothetical protein
VTGNKRWAPFWIERGEINDSGAPLGSPSNRSKSFFFFLFSFSEISPVFILFYFFSEPLSIAFWARQVSYLNSIIFGPPVGRRNPSISIEAVAAAVVVFFSVGAGGLPASPLIRYRATK